ncbi:MAG: hypothetical protein ACO32E_01185 [Ilumatobacteraceae bacterium]
MVRRSLPVLAALAVIAACGDDPDNPSALPVLRIGAGAASAEAGVSADMVAPDRMSMYVPTEWEFVVDGSLPALDSEAPVYVLSGGVEPSAEQLATLLEVLGVDGSFTRTTTDPGTDYEWTTWSVGPADGSGPTNTVSDDGMLTWWYSEGWEAMSTSRVEPCVSPIDPDGVLVEDDVMCPDEWIEPTPPVGVPSAAEAETKFRDLVTRLGFGADQLTIESYGDDWSAGAWGYVSIGGVRSSMTLTASFGENGRLTYAGGYLGRPERLATYPRVGTAVGLDRLRDDYRSMMGRVAIEPAVDGSPVLVDPVSPELAPDETVITDDTVIIDDSVITDETVITDDTIVPDETIPEVIPETIVVRLVDVEEEYITYWSVDGDVYLVPGYTFVAAEDEWGYRGRYTVPAIPSEYLDIVEPPLPVEPEPMPIEPAPFPGGGSSGSGGGVDAIAISDGETTDLIGLNEDEAFEVAVARGWEVRVAARDGEQFSLTMDYLWNRVNLTVENDVVTAVTVG